jgi:hypothetical protein
LILIVGQGLEAENEIGKREWQEMQNVYRDVGYPRFSRFMRKKLSLLLSEGQ